MDALGLSGARAVAFVVLMLAALLLLGYTGWLLVANSRDDPANSLVRPSPPEPPLIAVPECEPQAASTAPTPDGVSEVQAFDVEATAPAGLAYLPGSRTLAMSQPSEGGAELVQVTLFGDAAGTTSLPVTDAIDLATGISPDSPLLVLHVDQPEFSIIARTESGSVQTVERTVDLRSTNADGASGIDMDPEVDEVVIADLRGSRFVRIRMRDISRWAAAVAAACQVSLPPIGDGPGLFMAVRPADGNIFLTSGDGILIEVDRAGSFLSERDVSGLGLGQIQGMAFGPSADPTDPDDVQHLFILSSDSETPRIRALSLGTSAPIPPAVPQIAGAVVGRVQTSELSPPSSDPNGVTYDWGGERLIVTDSEIDELPEFAGSTVFALDADGRWSGLGTPALSNEITDVAIDPDSGRWFFTDDSAKAILQMEIGEDGVLGTSDDRTALISTSDFGSLDPEGITFGQGSLFVSDGVAAEVYRITPGADGVFNGVAPAGDDEVSSFDTSAFGIADPEGIAFDAERGTLLLRGRDRREPTVEVATDGTLLTVITLDPEAIRSAGGLALMPASDGSGRINLVIADRGADNGRSDAPNDGQLVEISFDRPSAVARSHVTAN